MSFFPGNNAFDLNLTRVVNKEAWDEAKTTDMQHESPGDLPVAAWTTDVDQPAFEIVNRMASEFKLRPLHISKSTIKMRNVMGRIKLQLRALVGLQRGAIDNYRLEYICLS